MALKANETSRARIVYDDKSLLGQMSKNEAASLDPMDEKKDIEPNKNIILQVGERTFKTYKSTLTKSPYFKALFSDNFGDKQSDGSYFIDRNGEYFAYLLQFLRCGYVEIPSEKAKTIQMEAQYFQIPMDFSDVTRRFNSRPDLVCMDGFFGVDKDGKRCQCRDKHSYFKRGDITDVWNILIGNKSLFNVHDSYGLSKSQYIAKFRCWNNDSHTVGERDAKLRILMDYLMWRDEYEFSFNPLEKKASEFFIRLRIPKSFMINAVSNLQ